MPRLNATRVKAKRTAVRTDRILSIYTRTSSTGHQGWMCELPLCSCATRSRFVDRYVPKISMSHLSSGVNHLSTGQWTYSHRLTPAAVAHFCHPYCNERRTSSPLICTVRQSRCDYDELWEFQWRLPLNPVFPCLLRMLPHLSRDVAKGWGQGEHDLYLEGKRKQNDLKK